MMETIMTETAVIQGRMALTISAAMKDFISRSCPPEMRR